VREGAVTRGLSLAQGDVGALRIWRYDRDEGGGSCFLVNAFAANDPVSTMEVLRRVAKDLGVAAQDCLGLLSLRPDRGDRTLQWSDTLRDGGLESFRTLFLAGLHARALRHRLRRHPRAGAIHILRPAPPQEVMDQLLGREEGTPGLVFGFGNIEGLGRSMVRHWGKVGEVHGV
jgi:hypothetical protein